MSPSRYLSLGGVAFAFVIAAMACLLLCSSVLAVGDVNMASCSEFPRIEAFPGFRSSLPDCRAYESVTPPYTGSASVLWSEGEPPPVSRDGMHILGESFGGFAGVGNNENNGFEFGAIYEFSRMPSGWSAESLEPPASLASHRKFAAASADLSRSLWQLVIQSKEGEEVAHPEAYTYAIRERTPGGQARFVEVGPVDSPLRLGGELTRFGASEFNGASHDLAHIVIASHETRLWPGDTTLEGDTSLYEYVGTGNSEPALVGVRNKGPLAGGTHLNEHAELISECGTILGSTGLGSAYNAISADGATVYFTAVHGSCSTPVVNELYARINGSETVAISEPTKADCKLCETKSPQEALFEGASEDGSKVFFLSAQELLSGAKGTSLYEYDFNAKEGERVVLISPEAAGLARISEDGSHVFFVSTAALTGQNKEEEAPIPSKDNLYVFDTTTGHTVFVGTLSGSDERDWSWLDRGRPVQATSDGGFFLFTSGARLTSDDSSGEEAPQVFEYDTQTESLARVSIGQKGSYLCRSSGKVEAGYNCNGNTSNGEDAPSIVKTPQYGGGTLPTAAASQLSASEDGRVFFTSHDALTPWAVEGHENIYEYREGNVYLISPGDEAAPLDPGFMPRLLGTDESGSDVLFFTADSLVPQDTDTQVGWYDARVGGGFPAPMPSAGCVGDACQGPLSATPLLPARGGSESTAGAGNLPGPASNPKPRTKPLTRARKLSEALKACRAKPRNRRAACESRARKQYGGKSKSTKSDRRGK
jgi:hypothetical protein